MNELITYIVSVLQEAPKCSLKAVELANDIRDHFGTVVNELNDYSIECFIVYPWNIFWSFKYVREISSLFLGMCFFFDSILIGVGFTYS